MRRTGPRDLWAAYDLPVHAGWPGLRRAGLPKAEPGAGAGPAARAARRLDPV